MNRRAALLMLLALMACAPGLRAEDGPAAKDSRYELGVGVGVVRFPYYPGAAESRTLALPFPYFVFHSPHLDVSRDRVRGKLFKDDRWALDVDFGGSVAVDSTRVPERQGMPDLDWLGEVGPALRYRAWRSDDGGTEVDGVLPVRVAMSAQGLTLHHRGWVTAPRLEWHDFIAGTGADHLSLDSAFTVIYVDRSYADYYYSVAPQYATAGRPAYAAPGGYAGWRANAGFSWHRGDRVYGAFVNYTSLHGAAFQSSPLVSEAGGWSFGVALSWVLKREP